MWGAPTSRVVRVPLTAPSQIARFHTWRNFRCQCRFKSPQHAPSVYQENDLYIQQTKLKNTLCWLMGEEQITHLGMEYTRTST